MPGSSYKGKLTIEKWLQSIENKKYILDIGPGHGTYSKLFKQNEEWHCVEIHEPYVERFSLNNYYDKVFIDNIVSFEPTQSYDVGILGDVLEHVTNEEAEVVLKKLLKSCKYLIISLPLDEETNAELGTCHDYWNNPNELHRGLWSNRLFIDKILNLGGEIIALQKYYEIAIYLISSSDKQHLNEDIINTPYEWFFRRYTDKYSNIIDERKFYQKNILLNKIFCFYNKFRK